MTVSNFHLTPEGREVKMVTSKKSVKINYLLQATWQLLLILVPLITTPYLSRVLGADQIGLYSYSSSIANYFVMFAALGMSTYGVREIAICADSRTQRSKVFAEAFCSQLIISVIVLISYCIYLYFIPQERFIVSLVWVFWILSAMLDVSWLFFGVEDFFFPTMASIISKVLSVIVIFMFVRSPNDLWIYCCAISLSYLTNQIALFPKLSDYVDFYKPSLKMIVSRFIPNFKLFVPVIAISLYSTLDKVMLGAMTSMAQTGYFEYSEKLARMPLSLVTAMGTVMLPRMSSTLERGDTRGAIDMLGGSIWLMLLVSFAMMFGIIGISSDFAPIFLGDEFASCDQIMRVLALIIPIVSTTNVLGRQYLIPSRKDSLFTLSVVIGAMVNISSNIVLIPRLEALGAAISTVLAEFSVLVVQIFISRKNLPLYRYFKSALPFTLFGLIMLFTVLLVSHYGRLYFGFSSLLLAIEVFVGALLYSVLSVGWCLLTGNQYLKRLLKH